MAEEKEVTRNILLKIDKTDIGSFIGARGVNLKKFIIAKTRKHCNGEGKVHCNINYCDEDSSYTANLKTSSDEVMDVLVENVSKHQEAFLRNKVKRANMPNTKYVFKTSMDHHMIPKFVGAKGRRIKELISAISVSDNNLTDEKVRVDICEDRKIRMNRLHFEHLETDVESENKVLITVQLNTTDRKASLSLVRDFVVQAIEKTNSDNYSQNNFVGGAEEDDFINSDGW